MEIKVLESSEIDLSSLFTRKTNTKYYFHFLNFPSDYGILKIGDHEINSENNLFESKPGDRLSFESINYKVINNFEILYDLLIEESYSTTCKITLKISGCYHSCSGCFENILHETGEEYHHCYFCKTTKKYFPFESKPDNCYNEEEMKSKFIQWFFDQGERKFKNCFPTCNSCNGASESNCLSCVGMNPYLYKGECYSKCPNETYPEEDPYGNKICKDCYKNCQTCFGEGNAEEMNCLSCSDDHIAYNQFCFKISNNDIKSFYDPDDESITTSCREKFGKFIKDNTNECIDTIPTGYYISNQKTGLLSLIQNAPISNKIITEECSDNEFLTGLGYCVSDALINFLEIILVWNLFLLIMKQIVKKKDV